MGLCGAFWGPDYAMHERSLFHDAAVNVVSPKCQAFVDFLTKKQLERSDHNTTSPHFTSLQKGALSFSQIFGRSCDSPVYRFVSPVATSFSVRMVY